MSKLNMFEKKKLSEIIELQVNTAKSAIRGQSLSDELIANPPKQVQKLFGEYKKNKDKMSDLDSANSIIEKELQKLFFTISRYYDRLEVSSNHPRLEKLADLRELKIKALDMLKTTQLISLYSEDGEMDKEFQTLLKGIEEITQ